VVRARDNTAAFTVIEDNLERSQWRLDFEAEIRQITEVMQMLGIDVRRSLRQRDLLPRTTSNGCWRGPS
jgi:hypothetical protein